jgi:hypothetical protein
VISVTFRSSYHALATAGRGAEAALDKRSLIKLVADVTAKTFRVVARYREPVSLSFNKSCFIFRSV